MIFKDVEIGEEFRFDDTSWWWKKISSDKVEIQGDQNNSKDIYNHSAENTKVYILTQIGLIVE